MEITSSNGADAFSIPKTRGSNLKIWAELVRLPNVFTAIADVLTGSTLAGALSSATIVRSWPIVLMLTVVIVALYWTGMIWNDLNDLEQDRQQKRSRPLADNRLTATAAKHASQGLLGFAIVLVTCLAFAPNSLTFSLGQTGIEPITNPNWFLQRFSPLLITIGVALCMRLYNSKLKLTVFGPMLMGLCRSGSLLLGVSVGCYLGFADWQSLSHGWMAALGHGVYVSGFTWAARREAVANKSLEVAAGWVVAAIGMIVLSIVPYFAPENTPLRISAFPGYPIVFLLMAFPLIRRAFHSIVDPNPQSIQLAIKQAIFSIVFFDAILALQFGGPWPAIAICLLILPSMSLGRFFRST